MHPRLGELFAISGEMGFKVNLTTNGTLLGKAGPTLLASPALRQVNISLHSLEEHHDRSESYQIGYIRSAITFAREAASGNGVFVSLRLWNIAPSDPGQSAGEIRNRLLLGVIEQEFGLDYRIEEKVTPGSGIKLADRIYLNQDYLFDWPSLTAEEDDGAGFCHGLRSHAAVLADGTVVPCCLDGEGVIALGNVHEQGFGDIIGGERARRIVDGFSRKTAVEELCRRCGYRRRFGGSVDL